MQIEGTGNKINILRFKHKGQDLNFQHIQPQSSIGRVHTNEFTLPKKPEIGMIEFEDIKEIDNLINTLKYFKEFCELQNGRWERR